MFSGGNRRLYGGNPVNQVNWDLAGSYSGPGITAFMVKYGSTEVYYRDGGNVLDDGYGSAFGQGSGVSHIEFYDTRTSADVPEPASLALFGLGLAGLGFSRRKR